MLISIGRIHDIFVSLVVRIRNVTRPCNGSRFIDFSWFLPIGSFSLATYKWLAIFSIDWWIALLLMTWVSSSLLFNLNLHLKALFLFSFLLLFGLLVKFYFGKYLLFGQETDALVKDIKVHLNNFWLFHERWQLWLLTHFIHQAFICIKGHSLVSMGSHVSLSGSCLTWIIIFLRHTFYIRCVDCCSFLELHAILVIVLILSAFWYNWCHYSINIGYQCLILTWLLFRN